MSASLDGYHVARAVMAKFTPFFKGLSLGDKKFIIS